MVSIISISTIISVVCRAGSVTSQYDSDDGPVFSSCGSDITVDKGVITSPEYPGDYPSNLMCRWRVMTQVDGIQIRVSS